MGSLLCIGLMLLPRRTPAADPSVSLSESHLTLWPAQLQLRGGGTEHSVLVTIQSPDGTARDATAAAHFVSDDPRIVRITSHGTCQAVGDGKCDVRVEAAGISTLLPVKVRGSGP